MAAGQPDQFSIEGLVNLVNGLHIHDQEWRGFNSLGLQATAAPVWNEGRENHPVPSIRLRGIRPEKGETGKPGEKLTWVIQKQEFSV